jgi:hypothetical protein
MVLINQCVVIFDDGTEVGEATARLATAFGANVTLVKHEFGTWPGGSSRGESPFETVRLDLSRLLLVEAWLAAFPPPSITCSLVILPAPLLP